MLRLTAFLLIGLVAQMLVAAAAPCCCIRAAAEAANSSARPTRPTRHCCGGDRDPAPGETHKGKAPTSHRDCSCKPGTATPADRAETITVGPLDVSMPTFVVTFGVWAPALDARTAQPPHDAGPPRAPSSASPTLLPVLRI